MAVMENASLPIDVWNNITTSSSEFENRTLYFTGTGQLALKVVSIIVGTIGVIDNLFVIMIFALFIKITDKVFHKIVGFW